MTKNMYVYIYISSEKPMTVQDGWQRFVLLSLWAKDAPAAL